MGKIHFQALHIFKLHGWSVFSLYEIHSPTSLECLITLLLYLLLYKFKKNFKASLILFFFIKELIFWPCSLKFLSLIVRIYIDIGNSVSIFLIPWHIFWYVNLRLFWFQRSSLDLQLQVFYFFFVGIGGMNI